MFKLLRAMFLLLLFGLLQESRADIELPGFSSESIRKSWEVKADLKLESCNSFPDNIPEVCGKLTWSKAEPNAKDYPYPGIMLNFSKNDALRTDWRSVRRIRFSAFSDRDDSLRLLVWNRKGQRSAFSIPLKTGRNNILMDFSMELDLADVKTFYLYRRLPPENWTVHLGKITLIEEIPEVLMQKKEQYRQQFTALNFDFSLLPESEQKETARLIRQGHSLASSEKNTDWKDLHDIVKNLEVYRQEVELRKKFMRSGAAAFWASSLEKVRREHQMFKVSPQKTFSFDVARGEGEGGQIIVLPEKDFKSVQATVSLIVSADGTDKIPADAITLHPVGYVNCQTSTFYVNDEPAGWWPDPIMTYRSAVPLMRNQYQAWFLDLQVPSNQKPGIYSGEVRLTGDDFPEKRLPFQVQVRSFVLPAGSPYLVAASLQVDHEGSIFRSFSQEKQAQWRKMLTDLFLSHRLNPTELYSSPRPPEEHTYKLQNGAESFNIMYLTGGGKPALPHIMAKLKPAIAELKQKNIYDKAYLYGFDEWSEKDLPKVEEICSEIKAEFPDLPIMTTAYDAAFGTGPILRSVDIYCPTMPEYEKHLKKIESARKNGKKIMWYTAIGIGAPYPNFFIEYSLLDPRLMMGVMHWKYQPDGFLYWSLGRFFQNDKVNGKWERSLGSLISDGPLLSWKPNSFMDANGEGYFVYPAQDGPIPSLRLKALRDGMEDYLYFKKLSDTIAAVDAGTKKMPENWRKKAREALTIEPELVSSLSEYTKNPEVLLQKRKMIADLLDQVE